jgi:hypothetical protein
MTALSRVARFFIVQLNNSVKNTANYHKMYQTATRNTKWLSNIPNGNKICQHFTFQGHPKHTQIGIFDLKRNHLATLWLSDHSIRLRNRRSKFIGTQNGRAQDGFAWAVEEVGFG